MSTTTTEARLYPCEGPGCSDQRPADAVGGSYCSEHCRQRAVGENLLAHVRQDHRLCMACFRATKEVERPPEHAPEAVVGWQYLTEHATLGEAESRPAGDPEDAAAPYRRLWVGLGRSDAPADRLVVTSTTCRCGTTDHRDDYLRRERVVDLRDATARLCGLLARLGAEGQHDKRVDARRLARTVAESIRADGTPDWRLAVGRAVGP